MALDPIVYHRLERALADLLLLADLNGLTDVSIRLDAAIVALKRIQRSKSLADVRYADSIC